MTPLDAPTVLTPPPPDGLHDAGWVNDLHLYADKICTICNHPPCPCCEIWCDRLPCRVHGDDHDACVAADCEAGGDMCCEGACTYEGGRPVFYLLDEDNRRKTWDGDVGDDTAAELSW